MIGLCFLSFATLLVLGALGVIFFRNPVHSVLSLIFCFFNAAALMLMLGAEFISVILLIVYVGAVAILFLFVVMMMNITPRQQRKLFTWPRFGEDLRNLVSFFAIIGGFLIVFFAVSLGAPVIDHLLKGEGALTLDALRASPWFLLHGETSLAKKLLVFIPSVIVAALSMRLVTKHKITTLLARVLDSLPVMLIMGGAFICLITSFAKGFKPSNLSGDLIAQPQPPEELLTNTEALGQIIYGPYALLFQVSGLILLVAMIGAIVLTFRRRNNVKRQNIATQIQRNPKETVVMKNVPLGAGLGMLANDDSSIT